MNTAGNGSSEFLAGGSDIGFRLRNIDWENTSLGSPEQWSPQIKRFVRALLETVSTIESHPPSSASQNANEELLEFEQKYRALVDTIDEGFAIVEVSMKNNHAVGFNYIETNAAFNEHAGLKPSQPTSMNEIVPVPKAIWLRVLDDIIRTGRPVRFENYFPTTHRWLDVYAKRIGKENSHRVAVVFRDITNAKTSAQELEKLVAERTAQLENSKSYLKQLINSSVEFICVLNPQLLFTVVNKKYTELIQRSEENLIGHHLFDINPRIRNTPQYKAILRALKGETVHLDKRPSITRPDLYVDSYFIPLFNQEKVDGIIMMERNVTDIVHSELLLEEKNRELERTNKELESFNYIASHDLQEPLRKIQTFIDRVKNPGISQEAAVDFLQKIDESAKRMNALIQSVMGYSRLSASREKITSVDLNKVVNDIKNDFELMMTEKQAVINSENLPVIKANELQMHQLFSNLISNSLKFSTEKPSITITCHQHTGSKMNAGWGVNPDAEFICLIFKDNGIGFDPVYKDRIFSMFQRLHSADEYTGTGIGLSIVKKIVDHHKGFITVSSKPNGGTIFNVWLPL